MATKNKAIIITGAANRLGFAFARKSLEMGFSVVGHYRSSTGELGDWVKNKPQLESRVSFVRMDLKRSPERLIEKSLAGNMRIEGLVNCASVFTKGDLTNLDHFEDTLTINAKAPLALAQAFSNALRSGWVINVTDAHISTIELSHQNYRISKLLLAEFTTQLAVTLAPRIRVNAIAPGAILPAPGEQGKHFHRLARYIPLRKTGNVSEIQKAYEYLVRAEYVTGQTMYVDGGWHLSV